MRRIPAALLSLLCLFCLISLGCRASIPSIPVRGNLAGQVIDTTVDSEFARYYLEHYLQNKKTKPEFDSMIDQIHQQTKDALPSREYLKYLSEKFSVDFATLYLAQHLLEDRSNTSLQSAFYEAFSKTKIAIKTGTFQLPSESSSSLILFVPG
ncbi:MAG: hypothetical protein HY731_01020, partial [Candidatus Tectomicrobia bacterium]|nr:hypothetical protein [Candidatus Tectomicrobia bacterium]